MIEIKMIKQVNLKGFTFIEGFPGVGLVGPMAISYIIDKLGMEYVGYMESNDFPPLISIHKNEPMPPVRVYYSEKNKIVTIFAEFAMPIELIYQLSDVVYKFIKSNDIAGIYSIGGIPQQADQAEVTYVLGSTPVRLKEAQKVGLKPVVEGVATGVSAMILSKAALEKFPDTNIMVPIDQSIIDPKYAEKAIEALNKLISLNIDITELDKESKEVEAKIRELVSKHKETHESLKRTVDGTGPSMYA